MDTRNEVERWADRSIEVLFRHERLRLCLTCIYKQFHFATVLSPWIRRALVAGGFGTGIPSWQLPIEIAPVVPYQQLQYDRASLRIEDPEIAVKRRTLKSTSSSSSRLDDEPGTLTTSATPFFHFDLASAVKAAEQSLLKQDSKRLSEDDKQ